MNKGIRKTLCITILFLMALCFIGCSSTKAPNNKAVNQPVLQTIEMQSPVETSELLDSKNEYPAVQGLPSQSEQYEVVPEWIITYAGFEASVIYKDKVVTITYPSSVSKEEIKKLATYIYSEYGSFFQGTELKVDNGKSSIIFPYDLSYEDVESALNLISLQLPNSVFASDAPASEPKIHVLAKTVPVQKAPSEEVEFSKTVTTAEEKTPEQKSEKTTERTTEPKKTKPSEASAARVTVPTGLGTSAIVIIIIVAIVLAIFPLVFCVKFKFEYGIFPVSWIGFAIQLAFVVGFIFELSDETSNYDTLMVILMVISFIVAIILAIVKISKYGVTVGQMVAAAFAQIMVFIYLLLLLLKLFSYDSNRKNRPPLQGQVRF